MKKIVIIICLLSISLLFVGCSSLGFGNFDNPPTQKSKSGGNTSGHLFSYEDKDAESVHLVGDFNEWSTSANPMKKTNGQWKLRLQLEPGEYQYKFFINNSEWRTDPNNPNTADDGYGGENSVVTIGEKTMKSDKVTAKDKKDKIPVTFKYEPLIGGKHEIYVAGDFNDFSPSADKMIEKDGIYEKTLYLEPGKYAYKFVVDGKWITDENAKEFVDDGFGGQNSVVYAGKPDEINALRKVEFTYKPDKPVKDVYLAGSMNDWNQKKNMMHKEGDVYKTTLLLKEGEYQYKFVVNGTDWIVDENADSFVDDGFGGKNSQITVDSSYPKVEIEKSDGKILTYGIPKEQSLQTVNPLSPTKIEFKTRAHKDDVEKVLLWKNGEVMAMNKIASDNTYDYYKKNIFLENEEEEFDYYFIYEDGDKRYYLLQGKLTEELTKDLIFHYSNESVKAFFTPDWAKNGIIYQIFMDRFYNGNKKNDPDFEEWYYEGVRTPPEQGKKLKPGQAYYHLVEDWYDVSGLKSNPYHPEGKPDWWSFYGGDVAGVREKLDYLVDLGITIIYFNPIFKAKSNHKYDAADYMKIDPHFGTIEEFKQLVEEAHSKGIKIILDVAFNHTGETFWAFQDSKEKGPDSEYYDWYEWKKWPLPEHDNFKPADYYECWWGFGEMPDLNFDKSRANAVENDVKNIENAEPNWDVVNYILGLADYWIGDIGLDGFRLDVPNEVPFWFWELFRDRVKEIKPNAYLVGEIWSNAVNWVNTKYFDAVMNYAFFKDPVMRFFNSRNCSARKFDRDLKPGLLNYPTQASQVMMNLIDSHDTHRYLETAGGDIDRLKMAVLFQMTYVGVPHIWYGDEVGMMGAHDPDCRRPFNWRYRQDPDKVELRNYYEKLIDIRKKNECLRLGSFETLLTKGRVYGYKRNYQNENIIVVINNEEVAQEVQLDIKIAQDKLTDKLSNKTYNVIDGKISVKIPAMSGIILE